jgi:hypothetical protein
LSSRLTVLDMEVCRQNSIETDSRRLHYLVQQERNLGQSLGAQHPALSCRIWQRGHKPESVVFSTWTPKPRHLNPRLTSELQERHDLCRIHSESPSVSVRAPADWHSKGKGAHDGLLWCVVQTCLKCKDSLDTYLHLVDK